MISFTKTKQHLFLAAVAIGMLWLIGTALPAHARHLEIAWQHTVPQALQEQYGSEARFSIEAPAVDSNGHIYVGINVPAGNNAWLQSYNAQGTLRWQTELPGGYSINRIIAMPSYLLVSNNNTTHKLNYQGEILWTAPFGHGRYMVVGPDDSIYTQSTIPNDSKTYFVAINPNGSLRWWRWLGVPLCDLLMNQDGQLIASTGSTVLAISQDNAVLWERYLGNTSGGSCLFDGRLSLTNNNVILHAASARDNGALSALSSSGDLLWQYEVPVYNRPFVLPDGRIIAGHTSTLSSPLLSANGDFIKNIQRSTNWSGGVVTQNGHLIDGVNLINIDTNTRSQFFPSPNGPSYQTLTSDGLLVFVHSTHNSHRLVALKSSHRPSNTGWPKAHLNNANNPSKAAAAKPFFRELAADILSEGSVAIHGDRVYAATRQGDLRAYNPSGQVIWQQSHATGSTTLAPLTDQHGVIQLLSVENSGLIYSYDHHGQARWSQPLIGPPKHAVLGKDATLYVASGAGWISAFTYDGALLWQQKIPPGLSDEITAMMETSQGLIATDSAGYLFLIDAAGTVLRQQQLASPSRFTPLPIANGQHLLLAFDDELVRLDHDWQQVWQRGLFYQPTAPLTLTMDGDILLQLADNKVYKLSLNNGQEQWHYQMAGPSTHAAVHSMDHSIYVASHDWNLYQLGMFDGTLKRRFNLGEVPRSAPTLKSRLNATSNPELLLIATADQLLKWIEIDDARLGLSAWPKAGRGLGNRSSLAHPGVVVASIDLEATISTKVLHDQTGHRFIANEAGSIVKLDPSNQLLWQYDTASPLLASMLLLPSQLLVAATTDGMVHAITPQGELQFTIAVNQPITTGIASDQSGNLYFGTDSGTLLSYTPDGQLRWHRNYPAAIHANPLIEQDWGSLFVLDTEGALNRLDLVTGDLMFSQQSCPPVFGSAFSMTRDGFIAVQCQAETRLYDFMLNARLNIARNSVSISGVSFLPDEEQDKAYLLSDFAGRLYSVDTNGFTNWQLQWPSPLGASALVDESSATIYAASFDGEVMAVNLYGQLLWSVNVGDRVLAPLALVDNQLLVATDTGKLHAIQTTAALGLLSEAGADGQNSHRISQLESGTLLFDHGYHDLVTHELSHSSAAYNSHGHKIINFNQGIRSLDQQGRLLWQFVTEQASPVFAGVSIGQDDTNYFGDENGVLYAVSANGLLLWKKQLQGAIRHSVAIGNADFGVVTSGNHFSSAKATFFSLSTGQVLQEVAGQSQPVIDSTGSKVYLIAGTRLVQYHHNGTLHWDFDFSQINFGSNGNAIDRIGTPIPTAQGATYIAVTLDTSFGATPTLETSLVKVTEQGHYLWHTEPDYGFSYGRLAFDAERQMVILPLTDNTWQFVLHGQTAPSPLWLDHAVGPLPPAPLIDENGITYLSDQHGGIAAVDSDGKLKWRQQLPAGIVRISPSLTPDGFLSIGSYYLKVSPENQPLGLAQGWPKYGGSSNNQGSFYYRYRNIAVDSPASDHIQLTVERQTQLSGETLSFYVQAAKGYRLSRQVAGSCPAGVWLGNNHYQLSAMTESCTVEFLAIGITKRRRLPVWLMVQEQ